MPAFAPFRPLVRAPWRAPVVLTLLLASACSPLGEGHDVGAVRAAFTAYRDALAARDGAAAVRRVGPATLAYYTDALALARHASPAVLAERRLVDRLNALVLRAAFTPEELRGFDGAGVFAAGVARGLVDGEGGLLGLTAISVTGDAAQATMTLGGDVTPVRLVFTRADGTWRLELGSLLDLVDDNLRGLPKQLEVPVDTWLEQTVATAVGHAVDASLWTPPEPPAVP